jgi:exodeoxyribonuclease V beta subunit
LLATPAMGFTLEHFVRLDADTAFASAVAEAFAAHVKRWQTQGFAAACRSWLDGEGVRARLMTLPDGERRLTNLLHLGELLQHAEQDGRTGAGLLRWLTEQKQTDKQTLEEAEMRLESDASAVRLVTVHKSKGLEYPIVFCAFLWRGVEPSRTREKAPLVVRRPGEAPLLDLHGYSHSAHQLAADSATLQEHLRLLYVALTRARNRCYLLTGPINGLATSALGWLLHARSAEPTLENLGAHVKTLTRATMHAELQTLAAATKGTVALVTELPRLNATPSGWNTAPPPMGPARVYRRGDFERWRIQSYSGLIAGAADEAPDHDLDELPMDPRPTEAPDEFSLLPRGTTLGTCLHAILEQLDFTADPADWTTLVDDTLRRHQLAPELWRDTTLRLLQRLTAAPLITPAGAFTLRAVSNRNRLNELEFFLPSRQFNVPALQRVFARHADQIPVPDWSARVANLAFEKADGFLHGYMDTIIEHAGRFYLFDWKTNWLGPNASTYEPGTVQRAMRSGFYVLQYHLYAVALRRYLRLRLGATDFGSVWGGVFYSFLRGVDPAQPGQGWFFHRPGEALLDELESVLESGGEL